MLKEIKRKILEGSMDSKEWEALEEAEREHVLAEALLEAISAEAARRQQHGRLAAGALFFDVDKPPEGAEIPLPPGYAISPRGVFRTRIVIDKKNNTVKAEVTRLCRVPFFIVAKDVGSGQIRLLVRVQENDWRGEWVRASRLTVNKLLDWLIFPDEGVKERDLLAYIRACADEAPLVVAQDLIGRAAVEILLRLFPARAAGVEFPALRAFPQIRKMAAEMGVDPMAVRDWYSRQRFILDGPGKVDRPRNPETGKKGKSTRMLVFVSEVKEFLQNLPDEDGVEQGKEGKVFRIRVLSGPDAGKERLVALPCAQVVPLGVETLAAANPLVAALAGRHWPREVVEVEDVESCQIQILEIDPPLQAQEQEREAQAV